MRTATMTRAPIPGLARIADATGDRQFAIALARGLEVLRAFGPADRSLTNRELCDRTGLPKATVSRMTHTLTLLGYLSAMLMWTGWAAYAFKFNEISLHLPMAEIEGSRRPMNLLFIQGSVGICVAVLAYFVLDKDTKCNAFRWLQRVLQRDLRHAPAYRLLAEAYDRLGERERAGRVLSALALLGYADPVGPGAPPSFHRPNPRRGTITDEVHRAKVALPALASPYMDLVQAIGDQLSQAFPPPWPLADRGDDGTPASRVADAGTKLLLSEAQRLHNCPDVEFLVAPQVPGSVLTLESYRGRPTVILEAGLLERADSERRFLLGRALEPLRGGYAVLVRLRAAEQREVERLLTNLLRPESERDATAHDFVRNLPRKSYRVVEKLTGTVPRLTAAAFFSALPLCADRAGLLSCDDVTAAARMMARLQGEELALVDSLFGGAVLLGQVLGGTDLVRYFLSDAYHEVRGTLRDASPL